MVAVIFLGIVLGFLVYEWNCYCSGVECQDLSHLQEANRTLETSEDTDHHQQHHHYEEDDDDDHDDHEQKDEDDHENHTHQHSQPLYHHAAIITDSGMTPYIIIQLKSKLVAPPLKL